MGERSSRTIGAFFVDLNELVATEYEALGQSKVSELFPATDHTHTTRRGAEVISKSVLEGVLSIESLSFSKLID